MRACMRLCVCMCEDSQTPSNDFADAEAAWNAVADFSYSCMSIVIANISQLLRQSICIGKIVLPNQIEQLAMLSHANNF